MRDPGQLGVGLPRRLLMASMLAVAIIGALAHAQEAQEQETEDARRERAIALYKDGRDLTEKQEFLAAYEKFDAASALVAGWANAHFNAGRCAFFAGEFEKALPHFRRVKELEPSGWDARENLIMTYQALGLKAERDAERQELLLAFARSDDQEYREKNLYLREEIVHEGRRIGVYEVLEPHGPNRMTFKAQIPPASESESRWLLTMESPDALTQIAQELGATGPGDRRYTIEGYGYSGARHTTFLVADKPWTYDEFREVLVSILKGEGPHPVSQSDSPEPTGK